MFQFFLARDYLAKCKLDAGGPRFIPLNRPFIISCWEGDQCNCHHNLEEMTDCCLFGLELCYLLWVQVVLGSIPIIKLSRYKFNGLFFLLNCFNFLASSCLAKHKLGAGGHGFIPLNGPFIIMLRGRSKTNAFLVLYWKRSSTVVHLV
jgi:hypothetical protein